MKLSIFSLIVVATLSMACATKKNAQNSSDSKEYAAFENTNKEDSVFASISRSFCFGKCPVYTLTINTNGNATYEGIRNVDLMGTYSGKFTPAQMNALIASAKSIDYMKMNDRYDDEQITDLPSTTTSIVIDGKRKQVIRRHGFPQNITTFENTFDELAKDVKWKLEKASELDK